MLDRALPVQPQRIALGKAPSRRDLITARHLGDAVKGYLWRLLWLLNRLIEAGGPMS